MNVISFSVFSEYHFYSALLVPINTPLLKDHTLCIYSLSFSRFHKFSLYPNKIVLHTLHSRVHYISLPLEHKLYDFLHLLVIIIMAFLFYISWYTHGRFLHNMIDASLINRRAIINHLYFSTFLVYWLCAIIDLILL